MDPARQKRLHPGLPLRQPLSPHQLPVNLLQAATVRLYCCRLGPDQCICMSGGVSVRADIGSEARGVTDGKIIFYNHIGEIRIIVNNIICEIGIVKINATPENIIPDNIVWAGGIW